MAGWTEEEIQNPKSQRGCIGNDPHLCWNDASAEENIPSNNPTPCLSNGSIDKRNPGYNP